MELLDTAQGRYHLKWKYEHDLDGYGISPDQADLFEKYRITEVIYHTDYLGKDLEFENSEAIAEKMAGFVDDLVGLLKVDRPVEEQEHFEKTMHSMMAPMASRQGIEERVLKDIRLVHLLMGRQYNSKETIQYRQPMPNPLGGEPLMGNGIFYFDSLDLKTPYCKIKRKVQLDPDGVKEFMKSFVKNWLPKEPVQTKCWGLVK